MPARDIKLGDMTLHVRGQYISEHSDAEYNKLRSQNESLTMQVEVGRKDFYKLQAKYGKLQSDYEKLLDDYNRELESDLDGILGDEQLGQQTSIGRKY